MSILTTLLDDMLDSGIVDPTDIARVLGTPARSVTRWTTTGETPRRENEERFLELRAVVDALRQGLRDEPARLWLRSPVPALDYDKPLDLVERGEYRRVIGAIVALAEGVTA